MAPRQRLRQLKDCDEQLIDEHLQSFATCWCGFSSEHVLTVLTHKRELSFHEAYGQMAAAGFRVGPWLLTKETLGGKANLALADFELAFSMWKRLDDEIQSMLSV
eukprot:6267791-Prymnesium_polylepis.1